MDDARLSSGADSASNVYTVVSVFRTTHGTAIWTTDDAAYMRAHDTTDVSAIEYANGTA